jgi:hypothetical protein
MFCTQMEAAIDAARTLTRLDDLAGAIWKAWAGRAVSDEDAERLAALIHARKTAQRAVYKPIGIPPGRPSIFPPKRPQRAPVRAVAIARRRHLAASGPMPPALASKFTTGELAVLRIVGDEVRHHGRCDRTLGEIAARAGVCDRLARNAIRQAARLGLLTIEERRRQGQKNLANVVRIVSSEWTAWIARGHRGKKDSSHGQQVEEEGAPSARRAAGGRGGLPIAPGRNGPASAIGRTAMRQGHGGR